MKGGFRILNLQLLSTVKQQNQQNEEILRAGIIFLRKSVEAVYPFPPGSPTREEVEYPRRRTARFRRLGHPGDGNHGMQGLNPDLAARLHVPLHLLQLGPQHQQNQQTPSRVSSRSHWPPNAMCADLNLSLSG